MANCAYLFPCFLLLVPVEHVSALKAEDGIRTPKNVPPEQEVEDDGTSLEEVLVRRGGGFVSELEAWAILYQSVQALQRLFLNGEDKDVDASGVRLEGIHLTRRGRVKLSVGATTSPQPAGSHISDIHREKMWIYSIGRWLKCCLDLEQCSAQLRSLLTAMLSPLVDSRPSLLHMLDVISDYCRTRSCTKPFTHILMETYASALNNTLVAESDISRVHHTHHGHQRLSSPLARPKGTLRERAYVTSYVHTANTPESYISAIGVECGRLYRQSGCQDYCTPRTLIGPEFIVRALEHPKCIHLPANNKHHAGSQLRKVIVVLLNGQKLEITCEPNSTSIADIFQAVVESEQLECNVTLGMAVVSGDDFVFPPGECRLSKVAPTGWWTSPQHKRNPARNKAFTLYLRFKLYLPSLRGTRWWKWKHMLYLQLRRSLLERQITCTRNEMRALAALALQAEFGDYSLQDHGTDYFLGEHYLPEGEDWKCGELVTLHRQRRGLDPGRAEEMFISHVMSNPEYGNHYHTAQLVNKDNGATSEIWVAVNSKGLEICRKSHCLQNGTRLPQDTFHWKDIKKLSYSKHTFELSTIDGIKYKMNMDNNKSFYLFRLAWLHHKFFMRLTNEFTSLQKLEDEFGITVKREEKTATKTVLFGGGGGGSVLRRATSLLVSPERGAIFRGKTATHCARSESCRETRCAPVQQSWSDPGPQSESSSSANTTAFSSPTGTLTSGTDTVGSHGGSKSSFTSRPSLSGPSSIQDQQGVSSKNGVTCGARRGVLMGTKAIYSNSQHDLRPAASAAQSDNAQPTATPSPPMPEVYLLNSSIKSVDDKYHVDFHESISESLAEKFDAIAFVNDRILTTVRLKRSAHGGLGLQVVEGKDGGVYVQAVLTGGPASKSGLIHTGDQIQAVNGVNVLSMSYTEVLKSIHAKCDYVELVVSQANRGQKASWDADCQATPSPVGYHDNTSERQGVDLLADVLQRPIEESYMNAIRYETETEADYDNATSTVICDTKDIASRPVRPVTYI